MAKFDAQSTQPVTLNQGRGQRVYKRQPHIANAADHVHAKAASRQAATTIVRSALRLRTILEGACLKKQ